MSIRYFLAKTDPETYSAEQFSRERETVWDGVRNPQALRAIRDMRPGDRVFIYHSMTHAAVVALAEVVSEPADDPANPKLSSVRLRFLKMVNPPVTLKDIKSSGLFEDWALVRQSRLSTMEAPPAFADWMRSKSPDAFN